MIIKETEEQFQARERYMQRIERLFKSFTPLQLLENKKKSN